MLHRYGDTEECLLHIQRGAGSILSQRKWCLAGFPLEFYFWGYVPNDTNYKGHLE